MGELLTFLFFWYCIPKFNFFYKISCIYKTIILLYNIKKNSTLSLIHLSPNPLTLVYNNDIC